MESYRELFGLPEFTPFFLATSVRCAAGTMSGFALGTLVYARTGSAALSALSMFGASFAQVIGAATLLSTADRVRPRAAMITLGLIFVFVTLGLAIPAVPIWALLLIQLGTGLVTAASGGIQWGLLNEIVPEGGYVLGRALFNMSVGIMHIVGFAAGGALVALVSARGALLIAAGLYLASVALVCAGLADRPPRAHGRASIGETWAGNKRLWSSPARRSVYLALWVPNGLIVGCEALFVPYARSSAGVLFVASAMGMLAGDTALGRFVPRQWRGRLISPLRLLLAAPYLLFASRLSMPLAALTVSVASFGYSAGLLLQERLITLTPKDIRGQALGLHSSGMLTMQAVGATIAGVVAQHTSPATAMTIMAFASVVTTLVLTPRLQLAPRTKIAPRNESTSATPDPPRGGALSQES